MANGAFFDALVYLYDWDRLIEGVVSSEWLVASGICFVAGVYLPELFLFFG